MSPITNVSLVIETLLRLLAGVLHSDRFQLQADVCSGLVAGQAFAIDPNIRDRTEGIERAHLNRTRGALLPPCSGFDLVVGTISALVGDGSARGRGAFGSVHGQFAS